MTVADTVAHAPTSERRIVDDAIEGFLAGFDPAASVPNDQTWGAVYDAGLSRVDFPADRGGLGVQPDLQWVVDDALQAGGVPNNFNDNIAGIAVVAPVITAFGTAEQQSRHLRRIFTCEDVWCQLFSEPEAGSDLASLRTRAERDGDGWTLTGHKVWNTMAHISDFGLLLARTSDAPRHKGITCFLLDMKTPGVEVRPIRQMTGEAEFNEVIFDGAFIPDTARVGDVDQGWAVALGTLMAERFAVSQVIDNKVPIIDEIIELWRDLEPTSQDAARRDALVQLVVRSRVLGLMRDRVESKFRAGIPGPEGSLLKLAQAELTPDIYNYGLDLLGAGGMLSTGYDLAPPSSWADAGVTGGDVRRAFLRSRAYPIEGGAAEIQRNTIAERILGLPRG